MEVKPKGGLSGKANLTIFDKNNRGGATIMVSKVKGGESKHAIILGTNVIKFILDEVIEGRITEENIGQYKIRNDKMVGNSNQQSKRSKCQICEKDFQTEQGLKSHMTRMHKEQNYCEICRIKFRDQGEFKKHVEFEHEEIVSPNAKKRKREAQSENVNVVEIDSMNEVNDTIVVDKNIQILEKSSWEESRLNHRQVEAQVNQEELDLMETFNVHKRKSEIIEKLKTENKQMEVQNDDKVLKKQVSWFEEEVRFQEMKRKMSEDRIREEKKRKRQLSIEKKKKIKEKKEKTFKDKFEDATDIVNDCYKDEEQYNEEGPGYMGWRSEEQGALDVMKAFQDIRKEMHIMDMKLEKLNNEKLEQRKDINNLKEELKNVKGEYKQCLEALSKETYERNKMQTINQVLKETLEAEKSIKQAEDKNKYDKTWSSEVEMSVEEEEASDWKKQKQYRKKAKKSERANESTLKCAVCNLDFKEKGKLEEHIKGKHETIAWNACVLCQETFNTTVDLQTHVLEAHKDHSEFQCEECNTKCRTKKEVEDHAKLAHREVAWNACLRCDKNFQERTELQSHIMEAHKDKQAYECEKCDKVFKTEEEHKLHTITVHAENVFNCQICNKPYTSMASLRRHDWRCHREVECNICGETIQSRGDIKKHRENKHQMFQKIFCKYYPSCLDGEECLFLHEQGPSGHQFCPEGEYCNNQSCNFGEQSHKKLRTLCMFQANCTRLNCHFQHTVSRKAFLGEGFRNPQIN